VTAETPFAGTKLPLTRWLLAIYLLTQSKNGIAGLDLSRQLGVCYNSAWLLKHKLMQAMLEREQGRRLEGVIQLDDAYWGGRRRGYKRGCGTRGKTPFVAAVATDPASGKSLTMRMDRVRGVRRRELSRWSRKHLAAEPTSIPQVAVAVVIAVEEAPFLVAVQRIVGGVQIEDDLGGGLAIRVEKQLHPQPLDRGPVGTDLVIATDRLQGM
jgi:hypothetical protein